MRIAYVITRLVRGGATKIALDTARRMKGRGNEVFFGAGKDNTGSDSRWPELEESGLNHKRLTHMKRAPGIHDIRSLIELTTWFQSIQPDLVHLHTSKAGTIGALAARLAGIPGVVYSSHGHLFHSDAKIENVSLTGVSYFIYFWLRRFTLGIVDRAIALSRFDLQDQVRLGLAHESRFEVIPNGLDMEKVGDVYHGEECKRLRNELGLPEEKNVITSVGRLVREKGHRELLEAFARLNREFPSTHLLIIGDGPERSYIEDRIVELELAGKVSLPGIQSNVIEWLRCSDLFCFPSYYESQGMALMEAMAVGLPCVSTAEGGLKELVHHDQTAYQVSRGNVGELVTAMKFLLKNEQEAKKLAEGGQKYVRSQYSLDRVIERTANCYERLR
ncbi:MAG: glycosyltransferase family 4 protein [bacterium]